MHNSSQCTPCTEGYYCEFSGKTNETGLCQEGFFCVQGSISKQQQVCPAGQYCPIGTHVPKDCPAGTFSNTTGLWKREQCVNCTAGSYCFEEGRTYPTGKCRQGYYCPTGSSVDNAEPCPIGLHCPTGESGLSGTSYLQPAATYVYSIVFWSAKEQILITRQD